jgi:nudix-type nucleoside diphosphatase (YffH/AdpP family)
VDADAVSDDVLLGSRTVFRGWFDVLMLRLRLNGVEEERPLVDHPSGSAVLGFDPERRVAALVRQTREGLLYLGLPALLEAVAGVAEDDDYDACARREMLEETGIRLAALEKVGEVVVTPATATQRVHLYLSAYGLADRVEEGGGLEEEGERVEIVEVPLAELWASAERGERFDAKTLMLVQALRIRRPELFA